MDIERIKRIRIENDKYKYPHVSQEDVGFLIRTIREQNRELNRYKKAYQQLSPYEQWKIDDIIKEA